MNDSFYKELECVFDKFPKYSMNIFLADFNTKAGREDILKPTIGNKSLHETGVRVVNFATSKNWTFKSMTFPHHNIHEFTWTFHNQTDHILIAWGQHSNVPDL
jgi:hypothetical protein